MYNQYFKIVRDDVSIIVKIYLHRKYQDDVLIKTFRLDYPSKEEIKLALKKWFFGNGTYQTHTGITLSRVGGIATHHKIWRNMHSLKVSDNLYLSAPDMYEFLVVKDGVRPKIDFQLSYHFC